MVQRCEALGFSWIFWFLAYETDIQPNANNAARNETLPPTLALPAVQKWRRVGIQRGGARDVTMTSGKTL